MWSDLGLVMAGGLTTLVATTFVQLWVVPRVEMGKRREDRWEQDVLALTELLEFDYADAQSKVSTALHRRAFLADPPEDANPVRLREARETNKRETREAFAELRRAQSRAQMLLDRITYLDADNLRAMRTEFGLMSAGFSLDQHYWLPESTPHPTSDQILEFDREALERLEPVKEYLKQCMRKGRSARSYPLKSRLPRKARTLIHTLRTRRQVSDSAKPIKGAGGTTPSEDD